MASSRVSCDSCLNVPRKAMQLRIQHILGKKLSLVTENVGVAEQKHQHHNSMENTKYQDCWSPQSGTGLSRSLDF